MKKLNKIGYKALILITLLFGIYACSVKKYIPEGEYLYRGAKINYVDTLTKKNYSTVKTDVEGVLYPEPNSKFLGMYPGLYFHYKAQREKPGFINKFLNKQVGEEPVYFSTVKLEEAEELINNRLENRGFFYSTISSSSAIDSSAKTVNANYKVVLKRPYLQESFQLEKDSLHEIDSLELFQKLETVTAETPLKKGMRFDLADLKNERARIDSYLK